MKIELKTIFCISIVFFISGCHTTDKSKDKDIACVIIFNSSNKTVALLYNNESSSHSIHPNTQLLIDYGYNTGMEPFTSSYNGDFVKMIFEDNKTKTDTCGNFSDTINFYNSVKLSSEHPNKHTYITKYTYTITQADYTEAQ